MSELIFKGVATALVTPFDKENKVEYGKLEELIEYQISQGCDALLVGGTTGRVLHADRRRTVQGGVVRRENGQRPRAAHSRRGVELHGEGGGGMRRDGKGGGGRAARHHAVLQQMQRTRALFAFQRVRAENRAADDRLQRAVAHGGERQAGGLRRPFEDQKRQGGQGMFRASGTVRAHQKLVSDEIAVYCGSDELTLPLLSAGAAGAVSVLSNLFPKAVHELCARFFAGDIDRSIAIQQRFSKLIKLLFADVNPIPIKTAMNLEGFSLGGFRLPLCEADGDLKEKLSAELKALRAGN